MSPVPLTRREDWPRRLNDYLAMQLGRRFAWGVLDCCTFADGAVEALTGVRLMTGRFGDYSDRTGAEAALVGAGYPRLEDALSALLPAGEVGFARRGDLVALPGGEGPWPALGVCGGHVAHALSLRGVAIVPITWATMAWRVG